MAESDLQDLPLDRGRPLRDQIYEILRGMIVTGELRPGAVIDEKAIAARFRVSRTPVHEAVKKLADEHLVQVRAQSGTTVARIDRHEVVGAHVIRRALEAESAALAAARMNPARLARLMDIQGRFDEAVARRAFAEALVHDDGFHRAIAEIAGYPMLWRAVEVSKAQLDRCRHAVLPQPGEAAVTLAEHRAILEALDSGEPEAARRAMQVHLDGTIDKALAYFASEP
jgi:DNA-binding GntR family transcriptional regulator